MLRSVFSGVVVLVGLFSFAAKGSDEPKGGGLSKGEVASVVRAHGPNLKICYERVLAKNPTLSGAVELAWDIEPSGSVSRARVFRTTLNNEEVEACMVAEVGRWTFPKSSGRTVVRAYPFLFKGGGSPTVPPKSAAEAPSNRALQRLCAAAEREIIGRRSSSCAVVGETGPVYATFIKPAFETPTLPF